MNRFFEKLVRHKILVPVLFLLLAGAGFLLQSLVHVNYDMASYLPEDTGTKRAIQIAQDEFDYPGTAQVMARQVTVAEAAELKKQIKAIQGVSSVLWLDDVADIRQPLDFLPQDALDTYYADGSACYYLTFEAGNYDNMTTQALETIRTLDADIMIAGGAESSLQMKGLLNSEVPYIVSIIIPICVLILIFASNSWIEPFMYLFVIGLSIAINMGTNIVFKNVSFITLAMAAILQLAISMDYSIFLTHRYFEERDNGLDVNAAIVRASARSFSSIAASALTTIAGFAALMLMQYRIGADIGMVLAKGIFFSFVTVMLLMPVLISLLHRVLEKTRHRRLMPRFGVVGKLAVKWRYAAMALAVIIIAPSVLAQSHTTLLYGDTSMTTGSGKTYEEWQQINEKFGNDNSIMVLVPAGDAAAEAALCEELESITHVKRVTALSTIADNAIAEEFLPGSVVENFRSENYSRIIAYIDFDEERDESFQVSADLRAAAQRHFPDTWYAAGRFTSLADIRDTVENDSFVVMLISLVAVGLILLLVFRSLSIPLILLFVIQGAIWFNMAIPYFTGSKIAYIGYLIISALQLGATIDYGILLSSRYMEFRQTHGKKEAALQAVKTAGPSILTSALILATAGLGYAFMSTVDSISELGMLIGRGAMISAAFTILALPALLVITDRVVLKTTLVKGVEA